MIILITGTPGTGKTTLAKSLSKKLDAELINITEYVKENKLSEGYDKERQCLIVDEKRLEEKLSHYLKNNKDKNIIIEGHLAHFIEEGDVCVVLRCEIKELYRRLKARGYSEDKIRENIEAEIFGICEEEAREIHNKVVVLESSKEDSEALAERLLSKIIKEKEKNERKNTFLGGD